MRGGREYAERGKLWPCLKQACNFLTRSSLASISKMYKLSTTLSEDLSNLFCLATHSPCWQQKGTPNTHLSITFECVNGIIGRVTPEVSGSLYILDFVWSDGRRVEESRIVTVWDVCGGSAVRLLPAGAWGMEGHETQLYFINQARKYEVRSFQGGHVIKKISFPPRVLLE